MVLRIIIFFTLFIAVIASTPTETLMYNNTVSLGAGVSDTVLITSMSFVGDSNGIMVEYNQDSVNGKVLYRYVSVNGYTDTTQFANLGTFLTIPTNGKATFSTPIPRKAGSSRIYVYLITTNAKASIQSINRKIYNIVWR
jgi:hypothetical protein